MNRAERAGWRGKRLGLLERLPDGRVRAQRGGRRESWQEPDVLRAWRLALRWGDSWEQEDCLRAACAWLREGPVQLP